MLTIIGAHLRRWRRSLSRAEWETKYLRLPRDPAGAHAPGLLLIQVDGLARRQLEHAIATKRLPFLRHLLGREGCRLHTFYSGLLSTTPAVQAELYYGQRAAVPAFSFLDPRADAIGLMLDPSWAKRFEADLAKTNQGLLTQGSSWSNIYTGGATQEESHYCGASLGLRDLWRTGKITTLIFFAFLHFPSFLRLVALMPLEFVLSLAGALRGIRRGQPLLREFSFILARVFVCVGLRELVTAGVKIDLARGLPVIHANFLGYDEQSHRRGPSSLFAHWTLRGIDRSIRDLHRAACRSEGRDYEVWIFSDHGQVRSHPFSLHHPGGLEGLLRLHWPGLSPAERSPAAVPRDPARSSHAPVLRLPGYARRAAQALDRSRLTQFEQKEFAVACLGPVGHLYFKRPLAADAETALITALLAGGVPGILRRHPDDTVSWYTAEHVALLPADTSLLRGPAELIPTLAEDLVTLARQPYAGNLICLGWHPDGRSFSFTEENGSHCGPSPDEVQGFLLVPPASDHFFPGPIVRPSALRDAALAHLGRTPPAAPRRRAPLTPTRLRVVTYNVHYCRGLDGRFAPERIARILRDLDPDLIALQELDCGRPRSRGDDQLAQLAHRLGLHSLFCPSIVNGEERYGHGLLCTQPIRLVCQARLPTGGGPVIEPRDALHAAVAFGERELSVITTHLGLTRSERTAQIDRLLAPDFLGGLTPDRPALFLGDLNLAPGGPLYRRLTAGWATRSGQGPQLRDVQAHAPGHIALKTFPSFLPLRTLDHIFVTPHFKILGVQSPANLLTRRASDHLPLVVDLEWINA